MVASTAHLKCVKSSSGKISMVMSSCWMIEHANHSRYCNSNSFSLYAVLRCKSSIGDAMPFRLPRSNFLCLRLRVYNTSTSLWQSSWNTESWMRMSNKNLFTILFAKDECGLTETTRSNLVKEVHLLKADLLDPDRPEKIYM